MIENTRLTDDAEYMCQVTPAQGQPRLSASAFLTILVPPELPVIENHGNGSVIDVSPAETTLDLTCVVRNGHPAADIQWLKNGVLVTNNVIYSTELVNSSKLRTAKSVLTIPAGREQHDSVFVCQAKNQALSSWMQTFVKLNVLSPPTTPTISGYSTGQVIREGDTLTLVCESRGGNPLAQVVWFKNNRKIDFSYNSGNGRSKNEFQFSVERSDNGAVFRCEASNAATQTPLTAEVTLNVYFPPSTATITGNRNAKAGETVTLTCVSSSSNPPAVITWTSKGNSVAGNTDVTITPSDHGGNTTTSVLSLTVTKADNNVKYTCNAVGNGPVVQADITLSVLYPPERPEISGYDEMGYVVAGRSARMTCRSSGGNPTATLAWYKGNQKLPSISQTSGNMVTSELTFVPTPSDNNAQYRCTAENEATTTPLKDTVTLTVYCKYMTTPLKDMVTLTVYCKYMTTPLKDTVTLTVYCKYMTTPFEDTVTLTVYCKYMTTPLKDMVTLTVNCKYTTTPLKDTITLNVYCRYTTTPLKYTVTLTVYCKYTTMPLKDTVIRNVYCRYTTTPHKYMVTLTVYCKYTTTPLKDTVTLTEYFQPNNVNVTMYPAVPKAGQPLRLKCISTSSNPPASIRWYKNTKSGNGISGTNNGTLPGEHGGSRTINYLDITPSADDHDATYYCQALNVVINQEAADGIVINVQFKPVFDGNISPPKIEIVEGERRTVDMSVRANPVSVTYTLYKDGIVTTVSSFSFNNGILEITNIRRDVSGNYALKAANTEGATFHNFSVNVLFKAEISRITSPVEVEEGQNAVLQCVAIGNPMVTNMVRWTRQNFDMTKTKQTYENGKSELTVYELTRQEAGVFKCIADNYLGEPATAEAQLIVKFGPIIDKSRQYAKAAGEHGSKVDMICKASGAPNVNFKWKKGEVVLNTDNTKYTIYKQHPDTTLYKSVLQIFQISKADYGTYQCVTTDDGGEKMDVFDIVLDGTSRPDPPYDLTFINSSHDSILFSWKPGFNGGLNQTFTVKYRRKGDSTFTTRHNIKSIGDVIFLTLPGLSKSTDYIIDVEASNDLGTVQDEESFIARTADSDKSVLPPSRTTDNDTPVIIILVVCVVGIFLLALNIGLILFFVRRRKKRLESNSDSTSHTNTIELYGPSKEAALYPMATSEDSRSYGTYEKNMDDLSDDFRNYEDEDIKRVFLPPPGYSYTPTKGMDSPQMNHKTYLTDSRTYLDDDINSQLRYEDPYRIGNNNRLKGTFDSEYDRGSQTMLYEYDRSPVRHDTRPKSVTDTSDRSSRPSSRGIPPHCRATPPPAPPMRSSSKGATHNYSNASIPPLPARNYDLDDLQNHVENRYTPSPGSVSSFTNNPNVIPNPNYEGPNVRGPSRNHVPDDMRGHLV
ncbi:hypothetical protein FSP39_001753 [Pinctada imbricata]|uniref:Nephrin n=1 Tax=Pinctada imbricata TaxID=66713 RepID=A0AA88YSQ1_PINIB|nr:hypothetical protein FSP39_001753 [Pinctada imbricata]